MGGCLLLRLLLSLLSLLLGGFVCFLLCAAAGHRSGGGADGRTGTGIAGDGSDSGSAGSASCRAFDGSAFWSARVLCRLRLSCRRRGVRINSGVLFRRGVTFALVLRLRGGGLVCFGIDVHADAFRWRG